MKKTGPTRILETSFLYCNKHGETDYVLSGQKSPKWKCCKCTVEYSYQYKNRKRMKAIAYKGGKCEICSYSKYIGALDFHHKDPLLKNFHISGTGVCKSWDKLIIELDKCQLLCRNCHFELHHDIHQKKIEKNKKESTNYHKKQIHQINARKLGRKISL